MENAILHGAGFSQELIGDPVKIRESTALQKTAWLFCALAVVMVILFIIGARNRREAPPPQDEISFSDPVLQTAVRQALASPNCYSEIRTAFRRVQFAGSDRTGITDLTPLLNLENLELVRISQDITQAIASLEEQEYQFRLEIEQ